MIKSVTSKYLIDNDQDVSWGLTINTVGFQHIDPGQPYPPKSHPEGYSFLANKGRTLEEYQFVYITKGKGYFSSKGSDKEELQAGDMFLLFPGVWHSYHPDDTTGWDEYWIGFQGSNIDNRVANGFFTPEEPIFHVGFNEEIVRMYRNAIIIAQEQRIGYQQMLAGIANVIQGFAYALHRHNTFEDPVAAQQIQQAKVIMMEKFAQGISPTDVAAEINMGYSKFRRLFKDLTGYAPLQYIQELRLQKSKKLLLNTSLSLTEIAEEIGYDNADYFSTAFKKKNRVTPAAYRKNSLERLRQ
jgi:AraC-like DNA-binding protein